MKVVFMLYPSCEAFSTILQWLDGESWSGLWMYGIGGGFLMDDNDCSRSKICGDNKYRLHY